MKKSEILSQNIKSENSWSPWLMSVVPKLWLMNIFKICKMFQGVCQEKCIMTIFACSL